MNKELEFAIDEMIARLEEQERIRLSTTTTEPDVSVSFNPAYMRDLCSVFAEAGALPVRFKFWKDGHNSFKTKMVRMDAEVDGQHLTAVIMPMRDDA